MSIKTDSAAKATPGAPEALRALPSVDELLSRPALATLANTAGRALVTQTARTVLSALRSDLKANDSRPHSPIDFAASDAGSEAQIEAKIERELEARIIRQVESNLAPSLRPAINATGVILHTNLGRAPLCSAAVAAIAQSAASYSNLEYDIRTGARGKREVHTSAVLASLVSAEAAIVVNNNAAAVFLVLNTLAKVAEVVVSRGELIEIGDGFRIPDIMSESGAILREVGTTNRTRIRDYERAITPQTRLLLRVHPSNFRITGFTERPSLAELIALGARAQVPVYEDLGSGCLADLSEYGIAEPLVSTSCKAGAAVVSFSGDKLLGGPQAGIIAGQKEIIERIRRNPLFRALRVDKLTIAALEATLKIYQRGALDEIPTLRMIRLSAENIGRRASHFIDQTRPRLPKDASIELREGFSVVGGGSTPDRQLPTHLVAVESRRRSATVLEETLRTAKGKTPVVARIEKDHILLDLRTVLPDEETELASALLYALAKHD